MVSSRTGTTLCKTDCHLISISKDAYDAVIGVYENTITQERIDFLKSFSFFSKVPNSKLLSLILESRIVNYKIKHVIYNFEQNPDCFYFIKEGSVELYEYIEEQGAPNSLGAKHGAKTQDETELQVMRRRRTLVPITIMNQNTFFGDFEIIQS